MLKKNQQMRWLMMRYGFGLCRSSGEEHIWTTFTRKGYVFHSKLEKKSNTEFSASGWLGRWKKQHGVNFVNICGEKMSSDIVAANEFFIKLGKIIDEENLSPEQVYNVDETGLNFKRLPQKTFSVGNESSAPGFKLNKE
jgi:hypothetical protein